MPSFYAGMPILIVRMGKIGTGCLFSQQDAHIHCENGYLDAYVHVNVGIGMPIFMCKLSFGMTMFGDAYIHLTPVQVRYWDPHDVRHVRAAYG